jgi:hypothetical protein
MSQKKTEEKIGEEVGEKIIDPITQWGNDKSMRNQKMSQLRQKKAEIIGMMQLLTEDLEKINAEMSGISGEIAGGDYMAKLLTVKKEG